MSEFQGHLLPRNLGETSTSGGSGVTFDGTISVGDIAKRSGVNTLGKVTGIPASLIVPNQVLSSFTNTIGTVEIGQTVNNFSLNWAYNRAPDPSSQSINHGIGAIAVNLRTHAVAAAGLVANTTYTITAVGDDGTPSALSTTISFDPRLYFGVDTAVLNNGTASATFIAQLTQGQPFALSFAGTYTFDASVGGGNNYLYIFYPTSFGLPSSTKFGGFTFTDYTVVTKVGFTNASGFSQNYYILKTNNQYNSAGLQWQLIP